MATIQMIRAGYSAQEARASAMGTASKGKYDEAEIITPEEQIDSEPLSEDERKTAREKMYEYDKAKLLELKAQGWDTKIRAEREGFGPAREYDHLSVGFTAEETRYLKDNPEAQQKLMEALREATKSPSGAQKSAIITKPHFDTANAHVHIMLHRHAVDVANKRIEQSDDLSKRSNASAFLERLNGELDKRGLQKMTDFRLQDGSGLMVDVSKNQAKAEVAGKIEQAGGVSVMRADVSLANVAVERESLVKLEHEARAEAERAQMEIQRLEQQQQAAIERLTLAQQAQAALIERDSLTAERDGLKTERDTLAAERDSVVAERNALAEQNAQLEERTMQQSSEIERQREEIESTKAEIERINEELGTERSAREATAQELAREKAEREKLAAEVGQVKAEVSKRDEQIAAQQAQIDELRRELDQMKEIANQQREIAQQQREVMQQQSTQVAAAQNDAAAARTEAKAWEERFKNENEKTMRVASVNTFTVLAAEAEARGDKNGAQMFKEYADKARSGDRETAKEMWDVAKQYAEQKQSDLEANRDVARKQIARVHSSFNSDTRFVKATDADRAEKGDTYLGKDIKGNEYHEAHDGKSVVVFSKDGKTTHIGDEASAKRLEEMIREENIERERERERGSKGPELE